MKLCCPPTADRRSPALSLPGASSGVPCASKGAAHTGNQPVGHRSTECPTRPTAIFLNFMTTCSRFSNGGNAAILSCSRAYMRLTKTSTTSSRTNGKGSTDFLNGDSPALQTMYSHLTKQKPYIKIKTYDKLKTREESAL